MKSKYFLISIIIVSAILFISNLFLILLHPIHTIINIFLLILLLVLAVMYGKTKKKESYNYALIRGKNIAGTVYSSYSDNVPGLGWIGGT